MARWLPRRERRLMAAAEPVRRRFSARDGLRLSALEWPGPRGGRSTPAAALPLRARAHRRSTSWRSGRATRGRGAWWRSTMPGMARASAPPTPGATAWRWRCATCWTRWRRCICTAWCCWARASAASSAMSLGVLRPGCLAAVAMNDIGPRLEPAGLDVVREVIGRDPGLRRAGRGRRPISAACCRRSPRTRRAGAAWRRRPTRAARTAGCTRAGTSASCEALRAGRTRARRSSGRSSARWRMCRCCCSGGRRARCSPPRRWRGCGRCGRTWRWRGCPASAMRRGWWSRWRSRRWIASCTAQP